MTETGPPSPGAITLDELIALNDEIAALVRAGVPLEPALAELGGDLPGRLGKITSLLAQRTARGEPLLQALSAQSAQMPPVYQAVVEAGLRTGHLSAALEATAGSIRRLAETRRGIAAAALYPLIVLIVAWGALAFFSARIAPVFLEFFNRFGLLGVTGRGLFAWLAECGRWAVYWGPAVPLVILLLAALWWYRSGRAAVADPRQANRLLGWLPWIGGTLRWSRSATFVELLALLLDSGVPLHEALILAAEASGDPQLVSAATRLAAALEHGQQPQRLSADATGLPPLLCWLMGAGQRRGALLPALRHAADIYHRRARFQADMACTFLPIVLSVAIGGSVTLLWAVTLFAPYASALKALAGL